MLFFSPRKKLVGFHRPPWGCPNKKRFPSEPLTGNHGVGGRKRTSFWNRFQHGKQQLSTSVNWCQLWCQLQNRNVKRSSRDHGSMVLPVFLTSEVHPGMSGQNRAAGTLGFRDLFCVKSMDFRWIFTEASMIFFWMIRCFYRFSSRCFLFWFHFFWKNSFSHLGMIVWTCFMVNFTFLASALRIATSFHVISIISPWQFCCGFMGGASQC